jgi:hypothetical protein
MIVRAGALALLGAATAACSGQTAVPPTVSRPREIASPARPGSGEPNLAATPDGRLLLSWVEPVGDERHALRFAERRPGGTWSAPSTAAEGHGWFVNWADFPALAVLPDGTTFAHWLTKSGGGTYAYDVRLAASRAVGSSWGAPVVPHRDGTRTEHGFVSLVPWSEAELGVVWLDGRKTAAADSHGAAEMALVHTTVTPDGQLGRETVLDGRVCDCCQTAAVRTDRGVVVAYRDRSDTEVRDVSIVRFADGRWSAPRTVAADGWRIEGCPVNGPSLAAEGPRVALSWFTAAGDQPRVKLAFSQDGGATFGAPVVVDDGRPIGRVDVVLLPGGAALVSWMEQVADGAELRVRAVTADGVKGEATTVADSSAARSSGFPRMERAGSEVVAAWRDPSDPPRVRTAVLQLR